jgi:hypothetical protein
VTAPVLYDWAGVPLGDQPRRVLTSPEKVFSGTYRHACLAGCGQIMVVPDRNTPGAPEILCEGDIWSCIRCGSNHEYYMYYKDGGRYGACRLLAGNGNRESGEPTVTEFLP